MNRETFAIGITEYAGVALLLLAALLAGAFDLAKTRFAEARLRRTARRLARRRDETFSGPSHQRG
jgi:hypothetical protein